MIVWAINFGCGALTGYMIARIVDVLREKDPT